VAYGQPVEMFLGAIRVTWYCNTVLPSCSTPDVSDPSQADVAPTQSVHNPDHTQLPHICSRTGVGFKTETETVLLEGKLNWNVSFDGGPSRFWGHTGLTENVADSLNDAVFQIMGVGNSNPAFELLDRIPNFRIKHCIPSGYSFCTIQDHMAVNV